MTRDVETMKPFDMGNVYERH